MHNFRLMLARGAENSVASSLDWSLGVKMAERLRGDGR